VQEDFFQGFIFSPSDRPLQTSFLFPPRAEALLIPLLAGKRERRPDGCAGCVSPSPFPFEFRRLYLSPPFPIITRKIDVPPFSWKVKSQGRIILRPSFWFWYDVTLFYPFHSPRGCFPPFSPQFLKERSSQQQKSVRKKFSNVLCPL